MKLTREEAINEHRKMWKWIAEETLRRKECVTKWDYFKEKFGYPQKFKNDCFLCDYVKDKNYSTCDFCPLDWGDQKYCVSDNGLNGLYDKWINETDFKKAAEYAKQIAELPEKEIKDI